MYIIDGIEINEDIISKKYNMSKLFDIHKFNIIDNLKCEISENGKLAYLEFRPDKDCVIEHIKNEQCDALAVNSRRRVEIKSNGHAKFNEAGNVHIVLNGEESEIYFNCRYITNVTVQSPGYVKIFIPNYNDIQVYSIKSFCSGNIIVYDYDTNKMLCARESTRDIAIIRTPEETGIERRYESSFMTVIKYDEFKGKYGYDLNDCNDSSYHYVKRYYDIIYNGDRVISIEE